MSIRTRSTRTIALVAAAAVAVLAAVGVGAWLLTGEQETWTRGQCGNASYEFSVEEEGDGLEVSYELQSASSGETWQVLLERGGASLLEGERQTDEDGELDVDAFVPQDGADDFVATVTPQDGESCSIDLSRG